MSVDCLVGLQFGSEGKGKWAGVMAKHYQVSVRVGAPNAGHTVYHKGAPYKMRQIPCMWVNPEVQLYIGAAGLVDPDLLEQELRMLPEDMMVRPRLKIDKNAGILLQKDKNHENAEQFNAFNGSTSEGCGAALARKVLRKDATVASMVPGLADIVFDTKLGLWHRDEAGQDILLEGTQGYGLSINHGEFPFVTSRDVLASSLLSDVGFAPKACRSVFGVFRTYPIRVAGNSGPMRSPEITWAEVSNRAKLPPIEERTTVTNRVRRVSEFNWELAHEAVRANEPDAVLVSFIEYLDGSLYGTTEYDKLLHSTPAMKFIMELQDRLGVDVIGVSTGPLPEHLVRMPTWRKFFENN